MLFKELTILRTYLVLQTVVKVTITQEMAGGMTRLALDASAHGELIVAHGTSAAIGGLLAFVSRLGLLLLTTLVSKFGLP